MLTFNSLAKRQSRAKDDKPKSLNINLSRGWFSGLRKGLLLFVILGTAALIIHLLFWFATSDSRAVLLFGGLLLALFLLFFFLTIWGADFSKLYLAALLCSGLVFSFLFTPFSVPDEDYHFVASYSWSNLMMGYGYQEQDPIVMRSCDAELYQYRSARIDRTAYLSMIDGLGQSTVSDNSTVLVTTNRSYELSSNLPQEKVASAAGITLARLLGMNSYQLYLIGRICNVIMFSALFYLAFRIAPFGKNAIVCISFLPMSLHLAASYSYDAFIIPMGAVLIALFFRAIKRTDGITVKDAAWLWAVTALLAPCKIVYSFIALLAILIPFKRFKSKGYWFAFVCSCLLVAAFAIALTRLGSLMPAAQGGAAQDGLLDKRGEETGVFYSISDVLCNPLHMVLLLLRTFSVNSSDYLLQMIGGALGWMQADLVAPSVYVVVYSVLLLISGQGDADDLVRQPIRHRVLEFLIFAAALLSVMFAMLFNWTFNYENVIAGVQGRYFLPVLPLLLLSIRQSHLRFDQPLMKHLFLCMIFVNSFYLIRLFAIGIAL